jgi:hypothetical protein
VADAVGVQPVERAPHAGRAVALAGVGQRREPGRAGPVERPPEPVPVDARLCPGQPEADQTGRRLVQGGPHGQLGTAAAELAGDVVDPGQRHPQLGGPPAAVGQALGHPAGRQADRGVHGRRDGHLAVADVVGGQVGGGSGHQVGHVLGRAHQVVDHRVHVDEVGEVAEGEQRGQLGRVGGHTRPRAALGQPGQGGGRGRTHQVEVQLDLGRGGQEPLDLGGDGGHARSAARTASAASWTRPFEKSTGPPP